MAVEVDCYWYDRQVGEFREGLVVALGYWDDSNSTNLQRLPDEKKYMVSVKSSYEGLELSYELAANPPGSLSGIQADSLRSFAAQDGSQ